MKPNLILVVAALTLAACGDDDPGAGPGSDGGDYAPWCEGFDEYMVELDRVMLQPTTPPDPESDEAQALERVIEAFVELPVPEPIAEDWALAMPRNPTPPERQDPVEQARARASSAEWIVENCDLSDDVDAGLRQAIAEDREYLDDRQSTNSDSEGSTDST